MTHFLQRTVLILLSGSALCACTTAQDMRPDYPVRTYGTAPVPTPTPAPAPVVSDPTPSAPPPPPQVERSELAPLAPAQSRAPAAAAPYSPPPRTTYETVTRRSTEGRVVDVAGKPVVYEVKRGDSLGQIADRMGISVAKLKDDNDLKSNVIRPGQVLKGPATRAKAYVVEQGDTLFAIARRFSVSADALQAENDLDQIDTIVIGQQLRLPSGYRDRGPTVTTEQVPVTRAEAPPPASVRSAPPPPAFQEEAPAPGPSYRTVTRRTITGRVVDVDGPRQSYTVKSGDSLIRIAQQLEMTVEDLKDVNNLKSDVIQPGQVLKGPRSTSKAYVAGAGDTLAGIAKRFGVTESALRSRNNYRRNPRISAGMRVELPDGYRDRGPVTVSDRVEIPAPAQPVARPLPSRAPAPAPEEPAAVLPSAPQPYVAPQRPAAQPPAPPAPSPTPRASTPPAATAPMAAPVSASDQQISQLGLGRFAWPLRGEVISDFGPKAGNQRNDGLNIRASNGETVRAAAAGDVVYAGDQVPGFGNLVLIKHADGWVTAYAHLSRVDVKMQQKVAAGQQVGQAGQTGGVSEPQLHFEVRYAPSPLERARPVDPKLVLPR